MANDKQLESLRTASKYKYEELMIKNGFGIVEECLTKADISKEQRPMVRNYCKNLTEVRHHYQDIVQSAITLRKKIFTGMRKFSEITKNLHEQLSKSPLFHSHFPQPPTNLATSS